MQRLRKRRTTQMPTSMRDLVSLHVDCQSVAALISRSSKRQPKSNTAAASGKDPDFIEWLHSTLPCHPKNSSEAQPGSPGDLLASSHSCAQTTSLCRHTCTDSSSQNPHLPTMPLCPRDGVSLPVLLQQICHPTSPTRKCFRQRKGLRLQCAWEPQAIPSPVQIHQRF